jgi:hypothetical protein
MYAEPDPTPPKLQYHPQFHNNDVAADAPTVIDVDADVDADQSDDAPLHSENGETTESVVDEIDNVLQDRAVTESALAKPDRPRDASNAPPD